MMINKIQTEPGNYCYNKNGEIERWKDGKLTHIRVTDEHDNLIKFLDVGDCQDDKEIHEKMMKYFRDYYLAKGENIYTILKKMMEHYPYFAWTEYVEFYDKVFWIEA